MLTTRRRSVAVTAASLLLVLTACSGGGSSDADGEGMAGMDMSAMNDPDATPADEVNGDIEERGRFKVLDTAPPGSDEVDGEALMTQNGDGTTVTIRLIGLEPGVDYVSHLHDAPCGTGDGGDHFKFDPDGEDVPPNEIHLGFTATEQGTGQATVTNDERVEDGAPSIVVHPADSMDNRLACANFS